jgi:hypothetical protein
VFLAALTLAPAAGAARSGEVTHLSGAVAARNAEGQSRILSIRSEVNEGDLLLTAENSFARVKFTDGTELVLRPGTQLRINAFSFEERSPEKDNVVFSLLKGGLRSITGLLARRNPERVNFTVPTATIGIRGTHFGALFCSGDCANVPTPTGGPLADGLHVDVADGRIVVTSQGGSSEFAVGQFGFVASPTTAPVQVPANRGIRVLLPPQASSTVALGRGLGKAGELECGI